MEYTDKILKVAETIVAGMKSLQRPANTTRETRTKANDPDVSTTAGATNPYPHAKPATSTAVPEPWRVGTPIPPPSNTPALRNLNEKTLRSTPNIQSSYTPPSVPSTPAPQRVGAPIPPPSMKAPLSTPAQQRVATAQQGVATALEAKATALKKGGRRTVNKRLNKKHRSTYRR